MATPLFECLRQAYAGTRLVAVARGYVRGVLEPNPWFDEIITADDKHAGGFLDLIGRIRRLQPDIAVVLPNSMRAALIARFGRSRNIYGYRRNGRSLLLSGGPAPPRNGGRFEPIPMVHYYLGIARWMQLEAPPHDRPQLFVSAAQQREAQELLRRYGIGEGDRVVGLNPGAKFGSSKCWPAENFARLAELLAQSCAARIMLLTGPGEEELGRRIVGLSRADIVDTGPDRVDLALLKALVQRCQLLVTNDTGPRHYAVALGVPAVVMMGPTDPRYTQANLESTIVLRRELDCAPCHEKICPQEHECMTAITPQEVLAAAEQLLRPNG